MSTTNKNNQLIIVGETTVERESIVNAGKVFRAVSHDLRLQILKVISEHKEVNVNVIYNTLKIEQSITSQHLKTMREAKLVNTRRDGKKIYYSLNEETFKGIKAAVSALGF